MKHYKTARTKSSSEKERKHPNEVELNIGSRLYGGGVGGRLTRGGSWGEGFQKKQRSEREIKKEKTVRKKSS